MLQMTGTLPQQFRDLEKWSSWAVATEGERYALRARSSLEELSEFCGALQPHMHDIIQYLSKFEWGSPLAEEDENLYRLGLTYMEATMPLDLGWKAPIAQDSFPVERVVLPERL